MNAGFRVYHHSCLEVLAERLAKALDEEQPPHPLTTQKVLVAHPGIGQWLRRFLATRPVATGPRIVANLSTPVLGEYLQEEFQAQLKLQANPVFDGLSLALAIFAALSDDDGLQEISAYFTAVDQSAAANQQQRWRLAERLAPVFSKYLRYRPQWIHAWEAGEANHWQAILWRRLVARYGRHHLAFLVHTLMQKPPSVHSESLHCFGFTHVPPDILRLLARRAEAQSVAIYFPNPCHEFWGAIESRRKIAQAELRDDAAYREIGHPLLASLGEQGQAFFNQLYDLALEHVEATHDAAGSIATDDESSVQQHGVLATLQEEIRNLNTLVGGATTIDTDARPMVAIDDSLLIVAAATRLRELELLRERLLTLMHQYPDLHPDQILVLSPAIEAYAALVPAVFEVPEITRLLPFRLVDRSVQNQHPLLHAGAQLLGLGESRFTVSEILGFLEQPALARRFGIDASEIGLLLPWLKDSRVAWGLDSEFRAALNAGSDDRNTWTAALDRLWLGYFHGGETIFADRAAVAAAEGQRTRLLAALDGFITVLGAARRNLLQSRSLRQWALWWQRLLGALFDPGYHDDDARAALQKLHELAANLANAALSTTVNEEVSWSVWRDMLRRELQTSTTASALPVGSILFCSMTPFRSLPFRVVAILGLNDGEFPREDPAFTLDRTQLEPHPGDRRLRAEDRYLFLESIMNARTALHLSYLGEDPRSGNPRAPATPLAELIEYLHERFAPFESKWSTTQAAWHRRAPLQPFDQSHIELTEPSLNSHGGSWHRPAQVSSIADSSLLPRATIADIDSLVAFYRHPARFYFTRCLKVRIDVGDDRPNDSESLDSSLAKSHRLQMQLLQEALQEGELPVQAPVHWHANGALPAGNLGILTWKNLRLEVSAIFDLLITHYADIMQQLPRHLSVDLDLGDGIRLSGEIADLRGHTLLRYWPKGTRAADRIGFFIVWAAATLALGQPLRALLLPAFKRHGIKNKPQNIGPELQWILSAAQLRSALRQLITIAESGTQHCLPLPIETAYAWFESETDHLEDRLARARSIYGVDEESPSQAAYTRYTEAEDVYWRLRFAETPLFKPGNPDLVTFAKLSTDIFTWVTPPGLNL